MMNYPEYEADLQRIHESEVYGVAVFQTAAGLTFNQTKKQKWLTLKALEEKTLERYLDYMKKTGQEIKDPIGWDLKGYAEGAVLGLLPWSMAMKQVAEATIPFQEKFLRLKENAETETDSEFFRYVYAHEKALETFALKELAGEPDSLRAAENLLNS